MGAQWWPVGVPLWAGCCFSPSPSWLPAGSSMMAVGMGVRVGLAAFSPGLYWLLARSIPSGSWCAHGGHGWFLLLPTHTAYQREASQMVAGMCLGAGWLLLLHRLALSSCFTKAQDSYFCCHHGNLTLVPLKCPTPIP